MMEIKELQEHLSKTLEEVKGLIQKRDKEIEELGAAKEETGQKIDTLMETYETIKTDLTGQIQRLEALEAKGNRLPAGGSPQSKSLGAQFIESDVYKKRDEGGNTLPFSIPKLFPTKALANDPLTSEGDIYLTPALRLEGIFYPPERPERVRDLLNVVPTTAMQIEYIRESGFTNRASTVGDFDEDVETEKPKSEIALDIESVTVKTIAHWTPVTRNMVADAPQIRSYIDTRLIYHLKLVEDAQLLYGSGAGTDLLGIMNVPGIQTYAWSSGSTGDTKIDAIRRAMTRARVAEYPVSGVVLHPNDWEDIETTKGSDGRYIMVAIPTAGADFRLWRVPVIETTAIGEGDFLLGGFGLGGALYDREQAGIRISEHHADFFTKNLLAIMAEERLALVVYRPEAFVKGEFDNAPAEY